MPRSREKNTIEREHTSETEEIPGTEEWLVAEAEAREEYLEKSRKELSKKSKEEREQIVREQTKTLSTLEEDLKKYREEGNEEGIKRTETAIEVIRLGTSEVILEEYDKMKEKGKEEEELAKAREEVEKATEGEK